MTTNIIGIRFQRIGKIYHFDSNQTTDLQVGDFVIVDTSRGRQLGEIVQFLEPQQSPADSPWKPITRKATPRDLVLRQVWQKKELEATIKCRAKSAEQNISGVKIVTCEFSFDGSRLTFLYSTEGEARVDLKNLRNAMQRVYKSSKVEMHQIGPRDVAKIIGGMGACGLDQRCCSKFITDFSPISIKMAKEQGISLSPSEITGMCGRLRCCLVYEYEQYVAARKILPKRNKRVITPVGEGKVVDIFPLKNSVMVALDSGNHAEYESGMLEPWDELEALRRKSQAPCDRHENGECSCGKSTTATQVADAEPISSVQTNPADADSPTPQTQSRQGQRSSRRSRSSTRQNRSNRRKPKNTPS